MATDIIARGMAGGAASQIGDVSIKTITKDEYDSITHNANTVYYVVDGDKVVQYFGDAKLQSGSVAGSLKMILSNAGSKTGTAVFSEIGG